jgi:hypothetical protein
MQAMQLTASDSLVDSPATEPDVGKLSASNHPMLPSRQLRHGPTQQSFGHFTITVMAIHPSVGHGRDRGA